MVQMFLWKHDYLSPHNNFSLKGLFICLFPVSLWCAVIIFSVFIIPNTVFLKNHPPIYEQHSGKYPRFQFIIRLSSDNLATWVAT